MAWTAPRTWVTGELTTAALLNTHLRDNLNAVSCQVYLRAYLSAHQLVTTGVWTKVGLDTVVENTGGGSFTSNQYTIGAANAGRYTFMGQLQCEAPGGGPLQTAMYVNGVLASQGYRAAPDASEIVPHHATVRLAAGDVVALYGRHQHGSDTRFLAGTTLTYLELSLAGI